jgi:hypothetical protein
MDGVIDKDAAGETPGDAVSVGLLAALGVPLAVAPNDCVDVAVPVPVSVGVPVELDVPVEEGVCDSVGVDVVDPDPVSEPVLDGLAPFVTLAVGVRDVDRERLLVDDGVSVGDGVAVPVPEPVSVALGDVDGVTDGVSLPLGVCDGEEPCAN